MSSPVPVPATQYLLVPSLHLVQPSRAPHFWTGMHILLLSGLGGIYLATVQSNRSQHVTPLPVLCVQNCPRPVPSPRYAPADVLHRKFCAAWPLKRRLVLRCVASPSAAIR
ncbi:hypothetical protein BKA80DRAFT_252116 [Phyllosticta citrichinensis]